MTNDLIFNILTIVLIISYSLHLIAVKYLRLNSKKNEKIKTGLLTILTLVLLVYSVYCLIYFSVWSKLKVLFN